MSYDAIGVIEARYFATALEMTDAMSKAAQVEWLASENYLGGRLVTVVIGGDIANVKAAVEAAAAVCAGKAANPLANAAVILKPHAEIMKFILPSSKLDMDGQAEAAAETLPPAEKKVDASAIAEADAKTDAKTKTKPKASRPYAAEKKNMKEES
ncbi:BMC domain-containing protein [Paenibacillus apiarius]|uniref:BMC domain-containing protein n=1 Tax=Paenibacillus apiarius TaxID=46240 RepID=A0ABT4DR98_9BACL|nr:BMC domain-containing protein [Paenibacillus apiarius]MCY9514648.1 BMC domain-containing protein [Paenibacillus apiarius]MCY9518638.1 BMC domain-containing protein [Paenibacillus apiarius]MCY9552726.1 BMC domain-containing protein [Paenibacillus apiarius]MCY9556946.1 BMC domain-containing protein [Paenibacillus apiarius]MCY9686101.1 BMC domain-containing protein [Paenibacillus apiarius]